MMKWKIIADSGCDLREIENLAPDTQYINVPLTVQVGDESSNGFEWNHH